jgi:uncharacterized protein (DUF2164 family)
MAKKAKQEVTEQVSEQPKLDDKVGKLKVKEKPTMKKLSQDPDEVIKVDLSKPPKTETDAVQERETEKVDVGEQTGDGEKMGEGGTKPSSEEVKSVENESKTENTPIIEEITDSEDIVEEKVEEVTEQIEEAITESIEKGTELPENLQKLMDFMEETGGDITDYVALNQDFSKVDDITLLREYYKNTKQHLSSSEIDFIMEDQFSYDEEEDDERDIKRKQLAFKEQVASARAQLEEQKSRYYKEIKAGVKLTSEQQKAINFFNRYNKETEESEKLTKEAQSVFTNKTNQVFNNKFKGFEYNIGDKKFRYNVKDANEVKETQSDVNNFIKKFLNKKNQLENASGYHKSLFTAMNADAIANHFYEQGKADAMKDSVAKSKNIDMSPRQAHKEVEHSGLKFKVLGDDSSDFKFKIKNK